MPLGHALDKAWAAPAASLLTCALQRTARLGHHRPRRPARRLRLHPEQRPEQHLRHRRARPGRSRLRAAGVPAAVRAGVAVAARPRVLESRRDEDSGRGGWRRRRRFGPIAALEVTDDPFRGQRGHQRGRLGARRR